MAFEPGHGRTAVPVRSALAGSVDRGRRAGRRGRLRRQPRRPGQHARASTGRTGTPQLNLGFAPSRPPTARSVAADRAGRHRVRGGRHRPAHHRRHDRARDRRRPGAAASGYLTLLAGRAPTAPDEIALGAQTLRALARAARADRPGRRRPATGAAGPGTQRAMRVVGTVVLPDFGLPGLSDTDLGNGAVCRRRCCPSQTMPAAPAARRARHLLQLLPAPLPAGHRPAAAATALLAAAAKAGCPLGACTVTADQRPGDIKNYAAIRDTPLVLAAVLGGARRRHPRPRAAHRGAPAAPRPGGAQDPRLHQVAGAAARSPGRPARWPPPRCSSGSRSA